jgi:hypothetical protein
VGGIYLCQSRQSALKWPTRSIIIKSSFYVIMFYFATSQNTAGLGKIKLNAFIQTS